MGKIMLNKLISMQIKLYVSFYPLNYEELTTDSVLNFRSP